jgi:hypothetical protein
MGPSQTNNGEFNFIASSTGIDPGQFQCKTVKTFDVQPALGRPESMAAIQLQQSIEDFAR